MISVQSKRKKTSDSFQKEPTFSTTSSVPKSRLRSQTPFIQRKCGFSLCKKHSIKFDRIYSLKDLQALERIQQASGNLEVIQGKEKKGRISSREQRK